MKDNENIASLVRNHRKKSGLSQTQLANLAGVGKTVIFDIEKGKETIQLDTLKKVLHTLNIELLFKSPLIVDNQKQTDTSDEKS
jgi:HTH-type transcriptional regulator / antitoxin HipB